MTVIEMVEKQLREMGADGLYNSDGCGCGIECLAPCGNINEDCEAAKKVKCVPQEDCCCDEPWDYCYQPIKGEVQNAKETN